METIRDEDILALDIRIKYCIIDPINNDSDEYYVRIYFNYRCKKTGDLIHDGWQGFTSKTKNDLLSDIRKFMKEEKETYIIC
jgi:hypothetical protein